MAAQDDAREREMIRLFNLEQTPGRQRGEVDAVLHLEGPGIPAGLDGREIEFELKSVTSDRPTFSTVRDFGPHYIEKWRNLHWLFAVYGRGAGGDQELLYCHYGSPAAMKPWFDRMADYVAPDVKLREVLPAMVNSEILDFVLGDAESFSYDDAKRLMKNQYRRADYDAAADLDGGKYSREAMLAMLRQRCEYIVSRGSTLNNPHIPASHFVGWERITRNHAARLRALVVEGYGA